MGRLNQEIGDQGYLLEYQLTPEISRNRKTLEMLANHLLLGLDREL